MCYTLAKTSLYLKKTFQLCPVCSYLLSIPAFTLVKYNILGTAVHWQYIFSSLDVEVQRMKKAVESLMAANEEKVYLRFNKY